MNLHSPVLAVFAILVPRYDDHRQTGDGPCLHVPLGVTPKKTSFREQITTGTRIRGKHTVRCLRN